MRVVSAVSAVLVAVAFVLAPAPVKAAKVAKPVALPSGPPGAPANGVPAKRTLVTLRGEIVDYYCFIEKGARGPGHRECGIMCVAGDVCMGLYTTDDRLFMISINHMRAMQPRAWSGIPDPFQACRKLIAETVDLTGYAMERKGQRIIEVTAVKPVVKTAAVSQ